MERRQQVILRLKRIEGQLRGLQRMVEKEAPCSDVLTQVSAVSGALKKVGLVILQGYSEECLEGSGKASRRDSKSLKDFHEAVSRFINWS